MDKFKTPHITFPRESGHINQHDSRRSRTSCSFGQRISLKHILFVFGQMYDMPGIAAGHCSSIKALLGNSTCTCIFFYFTFKILIWNGALRVWSDRRYLRTQYEPIKVTRSSSQAKPKSADKVKFPPTHLELNDIMNNECVYEHEATPMIPLTDECISGLR